MVRVQGGAPELHWEHPRGVRDLLGEVDLKVPEHLAAGLAEARDGREGRIFDEVSAVQKDVLERSLSPVVRLVEDSHRHPRARPESRSTLDRTILVG